MKKFVQLTACLAFSLPISAFADKVIGVADGDTLTVLHDGKPLKIRLADIDAPEKNQSFGQVSKQSLSDMCFGKDVTYQAKSIDRYGRTVARVKCAGVDVNRAQIDKGLAWVYTRYNEDKSLVTRQEVVRAARRGLWIDPAPIPPWEFRHPSPNSADVKERTRDCITGPRGGRYQLVEGRKRYGC